MNQGGSVRKSKTGETLSSKQTKPEARDPKTNVREISDADRLKNKNVKPALQTQVQTAAPEAAAPAPSPAASSSSSSSSNTSAAAKPGGDSKSK